MHHIGLNNCFVLIIKIKTKQMNTLNRVLKKFELVPNESGRYTLVQDYELSISRNHHVLTPGDLAEIALYRNGVLITDPVFTGQQYNTRKIRSGFQLDYSILNEIFPFIKSMNHEGL